ncbi:MAG: hypothetical protein JXX14_03465 [Deltaproteobacteria bacterium]|nr:hypothetical protein [Deltaproteobacteria bacterium]
MTVSVRTLNISGDEIPPKYKANEGLFQKVSIADTGTGIAAEAIDTIFDPFFTTKPVGEGTGLGLAVVDKIVKKHDGFIILKSESGKGTEFSVFFPVHNQEIARTQTCPYFCAPDTVKP